MPAILRAPRVFSGHIELRIEKEALELIELEHAGLAKANRLLVDML
jgi:hypothetical protein